MKKSIMRNLFAIAGLLIAVPALAQVTIGTSNPPYGWSVITGASRTVAVYPSGGATNRVNWSATGATLSCTTNCPAATTVTITAAGGTCSVTGTVGHYVLHSTSDVIVTATSVDDGTKTATVPFHICDTTASGFVDVEPTYNQAFKGQQKTLQSYVIGYVNQNVTWSILSQPSGGDGAFIDTIYRDTKFSATVTGRYVLKATSVANSSLNATAIIYVSTHALPRVVSPNKTESTECVVDPAMTGTDFEIGPSQTYTDLTKFLWLGTNPAWVAGSTVRIHNEDTTGTNPTTYHNAVIVNGSGTATQPIWICGVADSLGNLPIIDGSLATENAGENGALNGAGAFKFNYTNSNFGLGYEVGSTGPDYMGLVGVRIQNFNNNFQYHPPGSASLVQYSGAAGIYTRAGQHVLFEGLDMNNVGWGILSNNNTTYTGSSFSRFTSIIGNHIANFSDVNSYSEHALYIQGPYNLIEGNLLSPPGPSDNGNFIKDRAGSIIRYNTFIGQLSGLTISYSDNTDSFQFISLDDNLGPVGNTNCGVSIWCQVTTNNITISHAVQNEESMAHDYNYGNVYYNPNANGFFAFGYGSGSAPEECPPCTNMADRQGRLYFWNNTVHAPTYDIFSMTNPYTGSFFAPLPQYSFTTTAIYNNAFWNNPSFPFFLNLATTDIDILQTNMFPTGIMSLTPTVGGSGGWDNFTGPYAYPASTPISAHMFGLTSANFLTTGTVPYNTTTFVPISGSPLIGAGAAITDPEISSMPVRSQPNVANGFVTARTAGASTIGAEENGASPITVANPTFNPVAGTYSGTQAVVISTSTGGATICYTTDGSTPTSSSGTCTHGTTYSSAVTVASSLTIKAIGTVSGGTNSSVVSAAYVIVAGFNVNNTMSEATIQSIVTSADSATGNTVNFAGGNYTGWTQRLQLPCMNGTIYTGPANTSGLTYVNNQSQQNTSGTPAVLNSDNALSNYSILEIQGGNPAHTTPGSGCTVQNLTGFGEMLLITGGTDAINNPSYGILVQHNTVSNLTAESGVGQTGFFSHNTTGITWFENVCINNAYVGTGCFGVFQDNVNAQLISNLIKTVGEGIGSGFDITTGCSGCGIKNNRLEDVQRIGIEITNGNSPANVSGFDITGNLYILNPIGVTPNSLTGFISMACCYSGVGSFGYSYHVNDNVGIMNPPVQPTFNFYAEELTGGSNSQAIRNLIQGKWQVSGPAVAVGDIQSPIDISNSIIEGTIPNGYFGCEYGGTFPNACSNAAGTGIVANITANSMSTSATSVQQITTAPTVSPASGAFASPPTFTISNTQSNISSFYTTNGSTPTTASTLYAGPVACASLPCTVKVLSQWGMGAARAYPFPAGYGWAPSSVTTATYTAPVTIVADPTFTPPGGAYAVAQSVAISTTTSGASIIYTNNGTAPTVSSGCTITNGTLYTAPISVTVTITLKAIGCKVGATPSNVVTSAYVISVPTVTAPTFAPPAGSYPATQNVVISTITPGASVVFTSNGSAPSVSSGCTITNGALYTGPIAVSSSITLKAIGCQTGSTASSVVTAGYVIGVIPAATITGSFTITGGGRLQ